MIRRYGWGFAVGFFAFVFACAAAFIAMIRAQTPWEVARALAAFFGAFGGLIVFGCTYELTRGSGTGVSASWYRAGLVICLFSSIVLLAAAGWTWVHADRVATWFADPRPATTRST